MNRLPDHQEDFLEDAGGFLASLPGGVPVIAARLSINPEILDAFCKGKSPLEEEVFSRLWSSIGCRYHLDGCWDGTPMHVYNLPGSTTLHPGTIDALVHAVDCVSGGGDVSAIYEADCQDTDLPMRPEYRFLVVDRYGELYLLLIDNPELLWEAVSERRFPRFDGIHEACRELYDIMVSHAELIVSDPMASKEADLNFFAKTELAIMQMTEASPSIESGGMCYGIGDEPFVD